MWRTHENPMREIEKDHDRLKKTMAGADTAEKEAITLIERGQKPRPPTGCQVPDTRACCSRARLIFSKSSKATGWSKNKRKASERSSIHGSADTCQPKPTNRLSSQKYEVHKAQRKARPSPPRPRSMKSMGRMTHMAP